LEIPSYLMNFPFSWDCDSPNNCWMAAMSAEELKPDFQLAYRQFMDLYQQIAGEGLVYVLPSKPSADLQDLVYVANLGIVLCHLPKPVFVAANFKSPPRKGEEKIGIRFFEDMEYRIERPKTTWEGFADLKPVRDNLYIGGYGIRTDPKSYDWFEKTFGMKIIRFLMTDQKLYHADCVFGMLTPETALVCTSILDKKEVAEIEKVCEIIPVSLKLAHASLTNFVRIGSFIIVGSTLPGLNPTDKDWDDEHNKACFLERVLPKYGLEPILWNGSEYEKSGAAASCMVLPLNYASAAVPLL
jgi:N-dimethylarginine dimethylaminohydrolase